MSSYGNRLHLPAAQKYYCYTGMNRGRIPKHNSQVSSLCILTMWMQLYDCELYTETNTYSKDFCCTFRIMYLHWTKTRPKFNMDSIKAYSSISVCGTQWSLDSLLQFTCLGLGLVPVTVAFFSKYSISSISRTLGSPLQLEVHIHGFLYLCADTELL